MYYDHRLLLLCTIQIQWTTKIEPEPGKSHIDEEYDTADNDKKDDLESG